ncbi:MAG TPA: glucose 1-dehydrogenase [Candidatus Baltobacteraceae bacterium]|jgi:glucose 1-dehydrogenase|nr:glucose 1-dehydrogenase [Candidatus Baltobacteraceae bacterium]
MPSDVKTDVHKDDLRVDLSGSTAIITGGATGIGSAIAARFAQSGANVIVDYPNRDEYAHAREVLADIERDGGRAALVEADIASEDGADRLVVAAIERFGSVDILVNNAGVEASHKVVDTPLPVWEKILRTNLTGAFLCARAAARAMIERKRGGRIINISSVHEDLPMPGNAAYCASKGGMRMLMRTLALELAPYGITVNDIAPGAIATRINRDVRQDPSDKKELLDEIPLHRAGDADEVAALAAYLASKAAAYVTASTYVIDGGLLHYTKGL